jgi:hypothetical protein
MLSVALPGPQKRGTGGTRLVRKSFIFLEHGIETMLSPLTSARGGRGGVCFPKARLAGLGDLSIVRAGAVIVRKHFERKLAEVKAPTFQVPKGE